MWQVKAESWDLLCPGTGMGCVVRDTFVEFPTLSHMPLGAIGYSHHFSDQQYLQIKYGSLHMYFWNLLCLEHLKGYIKIPSPALDVQWVLHKQFVFPIFLFCFTHFEPLRDLAGIKRRKKKYLQMQRIISRNLMSSLSHIFSIFKPHNKIIVYIFI